MVHHETTAAQHHGATTTMLDAALDAAAQGWAVLPCHPAGVRAKSPIGQLVPHGHLDATADPAVITAWWTRWPAAMIGAAVPEHLLVLDLDPRNGGTIPALTDALGIIPLTLTAWSGRGDGGRHLYYHRPPGPLAATALPAGVDLKLGGRGYVILPPSIHPATGQPYRWHLGGVTHLPAAAIAALRPPPPRALPAVTRGAGSTAGLVRVVAAAEQGGRNAALFWAARRAVEGGHGPDVLDQLAAAAHDGGLGEREITATLASARREREGGR